MNALILAGGSGTRFWPLSRRDRPKQLLPLIGERSLLQETVARLAPLVAPERIWICTTERLAQAVQAQLPEVPVENILAEPMGRNTAPAIGWAVRSMPEQRRSEALAVLPSDHWIEDALGFQTILAAAAAALEGDRVLTLGVKPRWAETGYGYLELERPALHNLAPVPVLRFTEKPDAETAARFVSGGRHLWNAGIFVFEGATILRLIERYQPEMAAGLEQIAAQSDRAQVAELYSRLPAESIDNGVMEKTDDIATVVLEDWTDLGSWEALTEQLPLCEGNYQHGDVLAYESRDNLLYSDEGSIAVIGVEGLAVIRTGDSVLVMPRERAQDVREIVRLLQERDDQKLL